MAALELLAPRQAGVHERAVGGAFQFHRRERGVLFRDLALVGGAARVEALPLGVGAALVGVRLPREVGVLHRQVVQIAERIQHLVAAEQHGIRVHEGARDVLLLVHAQAFVIDEGAGDGAVAGVRIQLQIRMRHVEPVEAPRRAHFAVVEAHDHLALGHLGILRHHPRDVERHVDVGRQVNGHRLERHQLAFGVHLEALIPRLHFNGGQRRLGAGAAATGAQRGERQQTAHRARTRSHIRTSSPAARPEVTTKVSSLRSPSATGTQPLPRRNTPGAPSR